MAAAAGVAENPSSTPILDRIKSVPNAPSPSWVKIVTGYIMEFGFFAVIAIPAGLLIDALVFPSDRFFLSYLEHSFSEQNTNAVMLFFLCQYLAVVIHEGGHFVAGFLAKMRLNYFRVGPLEVTPPFRLRLRWRRTGFLGSVSMTPVGTASLRRRRIAVVCGGPLASLAAAALLVSIQMRTQTFSPAVSMFVLTAAYQGLLALVPASSGGRPWDGRNIMMLLFQKKKRERYLGILKVLICQREGKPIEEGDKQLLTQVLSENGHSWETFVAGSYCYSVSLRDERDLDAGGLLEICLGHLDLSDNREEWFVQAVLFQARKRKRLDLAKEWLEEIPAKTRIPGLRRQAEAIMLQAQSDIQFEAGAILGLA